MWERIKNEPAIVAALVQAVLGLAVAFGLELTDEQMGAIMAVSAAVLGLFVRQSVYSPASFDMLAGELADQ